jgi:hypothetical protein
MRSIYCNEKQKQHSLFIAGTTWNYAFVSTNSVLGDNEIQYTM